MPAGAVYHTTDPPSRQRCYLRWTLDSFQGFAYNLPVSTSPSPSPAGSHRVVWLLGLAVVSALVIYFFLWQPKGLTIFWATGNELDIIGFNLYRASEPDGDYVKINDQMIPGSPDDVLGGEYTYLDTDIEKGQTYYYKLERIHRQGHSLPLEGPIELRAPRFPFP